MVGALRFPAWLSALDRKVIRDLWGMKGQSFAIALVIAGGVAVHLLATGMLSSLEETRRAYYERYRFADIWASVVRAPASLIAEIRALEGVQAVETRVRAPVIFDLPGLAEPANGEILSLPETGEPSVNQIYLVSGRTPHPANREEVVVLQGFADAHDLKIGDSLKATIYGHRETLRIVGTALSPEHVFAIGPGQLVPDDRLYGVLWMGQDAIERATDQDGAFNEAVVRLALNANPSAVIDALDRLLEPYGAAGAYDRSEQISDAFVSSEIDQLWTMGNVLPPIFLAVAAFLVNVVISRLVATQRVGIGLMKAFGYSDRNVVIHYLKLVAIIATFGVLLGGGLGLWLGRVMAQMYTQYYRFPFLVFEADPRVYMFVFGVASLAVLGGAVFAVKRAASLNPAVAMTPPPPPDYSKALGIRITKWNVIDQQTRMILRQIVRYPARAAFTIGGIAASGALLIGTLFFIDSMNAMLDTHFNVTNRYDVSVAFVEPRARTAYLDLLRMPGVLAGEPFRAAPVRLRNGYMEERASLLGVPPNTSLTRMVDENARSIEPPPGGLLLSRDLADKLKAEAGTVLDIYVTEGRKPHLRVPIAAVATSFVGSRAQMPMETLNALLQEGSIVSGAYLTIDAHAADSLYAELKATPGVAGISLQSVAEENLYELLDQNIGVSIWIYTAFAGLIALGVVYNSVRISFAERQHELASLRVLGFSRGNVSYILLGEIAFLMLLALPLGAALGSALALGLSHAMSSDMFRLPYVIETATFGYTALVIVIITVFSGLMVRNRLDRLDLVAALKMGE